MGQLAVGIECQNGRSEHKRAQRTKPGSHFPRYFTARLEAGKTPYDEVQWETRTASIGNDKGAVIFEQRDVEVAGGLVADRHQHRRQQVFPRQAGLARARDQRRATGAPRGRHHRRLGQEGRLLQDRRRRRELPQRTGAPDAHPEGLLQFAGLVQRRASKETRGYGWYLRRAMQDAIAKLESGDDAAAVLGLLHRLGEGLARIDPRPGQDRRHAVQVGLGHGHRTCRRCAKRTRSSRAAAAPPARSAS